MDPEINLPCRQTGSGGQESKAGEAGREKKRKRINFIWRCK